MVNIREMEDVPSLDMPLLTGEPGQDPQRSSSPFIDIILSTMILSSPLLSPTPSTSSLTFRPPLLSQTPSAPSTSTTGHLVDRLIEETLLNQPSTSSSSASTSKVINLSSSSDEGVEDRFVLPKKKRMVKTKPRVQCSQMMKRGPKKNQRCDRGVGTNGVFCSQHYTSVSKEKRLAEKLVGSKIVQGPLPELTKIRINKLRIRERYYFIRRIVNKKSKFWGIFLHNDQHYRLKVPIAMGLPDGRGNYLWRDYRSRVVWKSDYIS